MSEKELIELYLDASKAMHDTHDVYKENATEQNYEAFHKATDRFRDVKEQFSPEQEKKAILEWRLRNKKLFITNCLIDMQETVASIREVIEASE